VFVLAVHSTTPYLGVALTKEDRILCEKVLPPGREHLENLVPMIASLMGEVRIDPEQVHGFAVAKGPGSFSGIRVGMAAVKGMALALGKAVAGISSLELLAWQALKTRERGVPVIDARRGEIYTAVYGKGKGRLELLDGPALILRAKLSNFVEPHEEGLILCGDEVTEGLVAPGRNLVRRPVQVPSVAACAILAWQRFRNGEADELHSLAPLYIRRSDAEENKNCSPPSRIDSLR
jgi:tRNA threonylcarbamoyladenosine biosynthesis protein TsaB